MKPILCASARRASLALSLAAWAAVGLMAPPATAAGEKLVVKAVTEKKVKQLPAGPLYWRLENFSTLAEAQAAIGPTSLAAEIDGKVWLFTLGPKGGATRGGKEVAEIGPVPALTAPEYLLRINQASGPPGAKTPVHSHPGSEAFYVLAGQVGQQTPEGTHHADRGEAMNGHPANTPMEVFSSGKTDLDQLVMFLVDATKPFSVPAKLE
ncbi:MAG TPA: cupin domain-containing protein [Stellaceae bacterium]|jgi:quercetin dioxygenase-like cupin family protein|nr:cupin domain-containing protein [Stellaceae bacterium]